MSFLTHGKKELFQTTGGFPLNALLHLIPWHLHVSIKHWKAQRRRLSLSGSVRQWIQIPAAALHAWTDLYEDAPHCGFPGWWRMTAHRCQTSPLQPWRGPTIIGANSTRHTLLKYRHKIDHSLTSGGKDYSTKIQLSILCYIGGTTLYPIF